jgi:hypothetical protein
MYKVFGGPMPKRNLQVAQTNTDVGSHAKKAARKTTTISFHLHADLRSALDKAAQGAGLSRSVAIENILFNYLRTRGAIPVVEERRFYPRRPVSLLAFISVGDQEAFHHATILDVSLGGLRLSTKGAGLETGDSRPRQSADILFALPHEKAPIKMKCTIVRSRCDGEDTEVGISFADGNFLDYEKIRDYVRR